jgi:hypothetical protein
VLFPVLDVLAYALLAGVVAGAALLTVPWSRQHRRFALGGLATFVGFVAWYLVLNVTHARGFNTDAPLIAVSWADGGSGVLAFVFATATLTLTSPNEPARRVVGAAAVAGLTALIVDIFVL